MPQARPLLLLLLLACAPAFALDERDAGYLEEMARLQPLAESGNIAAQYRLGLMFIHGQGVPPNPRRGLELVGRAAEAGHFEAALDLANLYRTGEGLPRDEAESARWQAVADDILKRRTDASVGQSDCE